MSRRSPLALVGAVVMAIVVASCSGSSSTDSGGESLAPTRPLVIATTPLVGDLVTRVAGDRVTVETVMPPGADPHDFEPSAAQAARLRSAALIVENGLGLEERLQPAIDAAERDGVPVLSLGELLDPLPLDEGGDAHGHGADDDHAHSDEPSTTTDAVLDPHVWLDPGRWARAAMIVAVELARVTNADDAAAATLRDDAQQFATAALDAATEAERVLATIPDSRRILVTNHDALGYFADRFGLAVKGVIIPGGSTQAEPSAAEVAELVEVLRTTRVPAIFTESTTSSRLPDTIAREAGGGVRVVVVTTDTLGRNGAADSTYAGLVTELARRIADGLRST